ncbi:MAG: iron ABC transporter substrate-binding protein [Actinomycetota bacterium]
MRLGERQRPGARRARIWALTPLIALCALLAACGGSSSASIVLYSGQHQQTVSLLVDAFTKQSGIKVTVRHDNEATLANQIIQEGSRSPADVFFAENSPPLEALQGKGILAKVDAGTLGAVASKFNSATGNWVGVSARASTFIYNSGQVSAAQLPASLLDLAGPAWKGRLGYAPSETDFQPLVSAVTQLVGRDRAVGWLQGLKANAKVLEDNESLVAAINNGDIASGFMNTYYWYRLRDEVHPAGIHCALAAFAPGDPGNLINVSGAAVLAASTHSALAQRFLAFLVSAAGQQIIATSVSYEYPIGSGVTASRVSTPLDQLSPPPVSVSDLGEGSAALALLQQQGIL